MNFWFLIIFTFLAFGLMCLLRRWHDLFVLMAVAIGCAVNSDLYPVNEYLVTLGPIEFSMDTILYSLFIYTLILAIRDYGEKEYKSMARSAIVAILLSGLIELFVKFSICGSIKTEHLIDFGVVVVSGLGNFVGVFLMKKLGKYCLEKKVNRYLVLIIMFILGVSVRIVFRYSYFAIINFDLYFANFGYRLLGMLILGSISLLLACLSYFVNKTIWPPSNKKD